MMEQEEICSRYQWHFILMIGSINNAALIQLLINSGKGTMLHKVVTLMMGINVPLCPWSLRWCLHTRLTEQQRGYF